MLHTRPCLSPVLLLFVMSLSTQLSITVFSIIIYYYCNTQSQLQLHCAKQNLGSFFCPREPCYSNARQAPADGPGQVDMSRHWLVGSAH